MFPGCRLIGLNNEKSTSAFRGLADAVRQPGPAEFCARLSNQAHHAGGALSAWRPDGYFCPAGCGTAGEQLGQRLVVENRGGAGGVIGTRSAMRAAADGYTLVFGTSGTLGIAPTLYKNIQFDPSTLVPVALVARLPHVLVMHPSVPVKTIQEFVKYGRTNSGKLSFGASLSTPPHLLGALFVRGPGSMRCLFLTRERRLRSSI